MKKIIRHPVTVIVLVILCIIILALCGFRITYNPDLDNNWDAISACAGWAAVIASAIAIYFAIQIPKKIAREQNMIELFEKRYELFQCYEKCVAFSCSLQRNCEIEQIIRSCKNHFFFDCKNADIDATLEFIHKMEHSLHQMVFLYPDISDEDVNRLYRSFYNLILDLAIPDAQEEDLQKLESSKNEYIMCVDEFKKKYHKTIVKQIQLYSTNKR